MMQVFENPDVSIIIPVYRTNFKLFRRCIRSLEADTSLRLEIVVIFDGKYPEEDRAISELKRLKALIQYISVPHKGVSCARNRGIQMARGNWLYFLDSDDTVDCTGIETALRKCAGDNTELIAMDYMIHRKRRIVQHRYKNKEIDYKGSEICDVMKDALLPQTGLGFAWGKLFLRD